MESTTTVKYYNYKTEYEVNAENCLERKLLGKENRFV